VNFDDQPRLRYLELLGYSQADVSRQVNEVLRASAGFSQNGGNLKGKKKKSVAQPQEESDSFVDLASTGLATLDPFVSIVCLRVHFVHSHILI